LAGGLASATLLQLGLAIGLAAAKWLRLGLASAVGYG